jgi:hypothetical protein
MSSPKNTPVPTARRRLWPWFIAGFAPMFVGLSLVVTMYPLHHSGRAVIECPLWRYYMIEMRRALTSSGYVGPADGSFAAAIEAFLLHLTASSASGAALAATSWLVRRNNRKGKP